MCIRDRSSTSVSKTDKYLLDGLNIQNHSLRNLTFLSMDFTPIKDEFSKSLMGILSLSCLSKEGILIDFKNHKIYF